jgi:hypothetical protein
VLAVGSVAFRPPASASWASCPAEEFRPSCDRPTNPSRDWTSTGFPRSAHARYDRGGRPLYPEAKRCSHDQRVNSGRRLPPLPAARPYRPGTHPVCPGSVLRGVTGGSLAFARSGLPLAWLLPRTERGPWAFPPSSAPPTGKTRRAHVEVGTDLEH